MIIDSSAVVAVFLQERGYEDVTAKLLAARARAIGAPTTAECGIVLSAKLKTDVVGILSRFLQELDVVVVPFGDDHWREATDAYTRYGRGRHPAGLNFGDCMTYAVARLADEPLLCVGDDFRHTDLTLA